MTREYINKTKCFFTVIFVIITGLIVILTSAEASEVIKVGIFQNKPIVFSENGPKGLFVEVLDYVAKKEGWKIDYEICELRNCFTLLKSQQLDIMTSLGISPERSEFLNFSKEAVWSFWGTVYSKDMKIHSVLDLKNKTIGVRKKNKITFELRNMLHRFNIPVQYVEFDNYEEAFKAFTNNDIETIAVNNTYGFDKQEELYLHKTPIIFSPFPAFFASPKNNIHNSKLTIIDNYVRKLRKDKESLFDAFERKWFGGSRTYWTGKKIGSISAFIIIFTVCIMSFWRYRSLVNINKQLSTNIAVRKQAEKDLAESEKRISLALKGADLGIWDWNIKTGHVVFSDRWLEMIGYEPGELKPNFKTWEDLLHPDDKNETNKILNLHFEDKKQEYRVDFRLKSKSGDWKWIQARGMVVERDELNKPARMTGTHLDITQQVKSSKEKNELEGRLQQAQKMEAIGTLAGGIAHDFNNILGVILGYADMAKEDAPPGTKLDKDLDKVLKAAFRAKDLVKQILAFSRQAQIERVPITIQPLIREGLKMLRSSIPTTISITEEIDPMSGTVLADPTQVHQILMNLCTNAYHAMEDTGGTLSVVLKTILVNSDDKELLLHLSSGEYVKFSVSDTGTGIGLDVIEKIFDPYFTTKEVGKGTGMGLSIIHGIMKDYGGTIEVESQLGKGTTFHAYFPVIEKDAIPEIIETEDIPRGEERVLFIDDEELLAEMGKDMLERLGYQVTIRLSSVEALTTFQNSPDEFDIVITDQTMPDMTGSDLARRMMQIKPDIPIILCTGYSNLIDEHSAQVLGIKEFALKPLTKEVIAKLIREVLDTA